MEGKALVRSAEPVVVLRPGPDFADVAAAPLAAILQIAFEAAVLPNRFEIDEQTPNSRLEALMEQAFAEVNRGPVAISETERLAILRFVRVVAERIRVSIRQLPPEQQ